MREKGRTRAGKRGGMEGVEEARKKRGKGGRERRWWRSKGGGGETGQRGEEEEGKEGGNGSREGFIKPYPALQRWAFAGAPHVRANAAALGPSPVALDPKHDKEGGKEEKD